MNISSAETSSTTVDPAFIARIAREVIARLKSLPPTTIDERIVTAETVSRAIAGGAKQIRIPAKAIITPAARDEAAGHGIALVAAETAASNGNRPSSAANTTAQDAGRDVAFNNQLALRGITCSTNIVLSDKPSLEVYTRCKNGQRAVMVSNLGAVDRFAAELSPDVWVLDMIALNMIAAVNVAARIAQRT